MNSNRRQIIRTVIKFFLIFVALLAACVAVIVYQVSAWGTTVELSEAKFDAAYLQEVSARTGLNFPAGTRGIEYYYNVGIDASLVAKLVIPKKGFDELLQNELFRAGKSDRIESFLGSRMKWWHVSKLTNRLDRFMPLQRGDFVQCWLGEESNKLILCVSWWDT
ncbi:MAG: hypothetical protein ABIZ49_05795 [Opitutaceae bacterium]